MASVSATRGVTVTSSPPITMRSWPGVEIGTNRGGHDGPQVRAGPMAARQLIVRLAQRQQAPLERLAECLRRSSVARGLRGQRLHRRQRVLHAMIELVHQELLAVLRFLARGNVLDDAHAVEEQARRVAHRR